MNTAPAPTAHAAALMLLEDRELKKVQLMQEEIEAIGAAFLDRPLKSNQEASAVTDLGRRASVAYQELEELRDSLVRPLNTQVKLINAFFGDYTGPLEQKVIKRAKVLVTTWQAQERDRIRREREETQRQMDEAARKQREAEEKAAAAKTEATRKKAREEAEAASAAIAAAQVAMPREAPKHVRGNEGSAIAGSVWMLQGIHNLDLVPLKYWRDATVIEALEKVLRRAIRAGEREIPGCSIGPEDTISFR